MAATAQWFLEGSRKYGAKGFRNAAASFAPHDLDVVSVREMSVVFAARCARDRDSLLFTGSWDACSSDGEECCARAERADSVVVAGCPTKTQ